MLKRQLSFLLTQVQEERVAREILYSLMVTDAQTHQKCSSCKENSTQKIPLHQGSGGASLSCLAQSPNAAGITSSLIVLLLSPKQGR